jgi:hypothetical protein
MRAILLVIGLLFASGAASAAGCPAGTKYQCTQSAKGKVVCSCH